MYNIHQFPNLIALQRLQNIINLGIYKNCKGIKYLVNLCDMPITKYGKHFGFYLPEVFINRCLKKSKNPGDGKMVSLLSCGKFDLVEIYFET